MRYEAEGRDGLKERSRRPKHSPNATVESVEKLILKERRKHPTWGPKKIRDLLMKIHGIGRPPHESTIALVLSRHGLSRKRKRKAGVYRIHPEHLTEPTRPNEVWTFDFKGWFILQDGQRCDPFTGCDRFSRYVIGCRACPNQQFKGTFRVCKKLMRHHLKIRNYAERTVDNRRGYINRFIIWCEERGLIRPEQITKQILELYQRHLYVYRDPRSGKKLSFRTQSVRLVQLRGFFSWLCKRDLLPANPASDLDLPRPEQRLPKYILNPHDVEVILAQPDVSTESGLRDRAMLETFYSTGIRRSELAHLKIHDIDYDRRTLTVRQGKGKKDRMVPIGERALSWINKYTEEVRVAFSCSRSDEALFLSNLGEAFSPMRLTQLVRGYVQAADIGKRGSCHLLRHALATHMHENGADIRFIQEILGHAKLETTQVYTHVSIRQLQEVYERTHPAAKLRRRKEQK